MKRLMLGLISLVGFGSVVFAGSETYTSKASYRPVRNGTRTMS